MIRIAIVILFLAISPLTGANDSTAEWQTTVNTLLVIDWLQSRRVATSNGKYSEVNPILGTKPSLGRVNSYFAGSIALLNITGTLIPDKYARMLYKSISAVEVSAVSHNIHIGVNLEF